jgi:hypothetical protein
MKTSMEHAMSDSFDQRILPKSGMMINHYHALYRMDVERLNS